MKTQLLLTLLLGFALRLEAQHFQVVDQTDFDNRFTVSAPIPGGGFYAAVQAGKPELDFAHCRVLRYDSLGNELWRLDLPGLERDLAYKMLVLPDNSILVCGSNEPCNFGSFGFLVRIGADGVVQWHYYDNFELYAVHTMTIDDTGKVWVYTTNYLHGFDVETGEYLVSHELPIMGFWEYNDVYFNAYHQQFYLVGNVGVHSFSTTTGNFETITYLQGSEPFLEILPLNDSIMLTYSKQGEVVLFGANALTDTVDWSSHGSEMVAVKNDGRFAVYSNGKLLVYGPDFQLQQQFDPWLGGLTVNDMIWSNNRIVLAGDEAHTLDADYRNTAAWMQSYDLDGQTYNSMMEVEMMEVVKTQQPVATLFIDIWQPFYSVTQGAFEVRIRNLSFATLDSLTIHTAYYGIDEVYIDCAPLSSRKSVTFTGLNLGPAEEITIPIGLVESPYVPYNRINPWTVCMWVGNPNGQTDNDHTNNLACVDVYPTVSTDEPDAGAFALFPNPATNACTINWGENLRPETVQVYDVYGRLLLSETMDSHAGQYVLELGAWPSGFYTVILDKAVRRLVKM